MQQRRVLPLDIARFVNCHHGKRHRRVRLCRDDALLRKKEERFSARKNFPTFIYSRAGVECLNSLEFSVLIFVLCIALLNCFIDLVYVFVYTIFIINVMYTGKSYTVDFLWNVCYCVIRVILFLLIYKIFLNVTIRIYYHYTLKILLIYNNKILEWSNTLMVGMKVIILSWNNNQLFKYSSSHNIFIIIRTLIFLSIFILLYSENLKFWDK